MQMLSLIHIYYDDIYRIPDGGVVQVDYPDGRSFTARLEHLDLSLIHISLAKMIHDLHESRSVPHPLE